MRVALVSSVGKCGIAEHSVALIRYVMAADLGIRFFLDSAWLDPDAFGAENPVTAFDIVHLNYHRGLHSRWTPEKIRCFPDLPFVITFHDTYERQPDRLPWDLLDCRNVRAMIVHEPCDLLPDYPMPVGHNAPAVGGKDIANAEKVHYWRQFVPERVSRFTRDPINEWRPVLGTVGFDFPWKNYELLAKVTGELGWVLRIVGEVSPERQAILQDLNPRLVCDGWVSAANAVEALEECTATAFLYSCANSGTSGAIRLGIAAARPLCATAKGCRQFRDLQGVDQAATQAGTWDYTGISWIEPTAADLSLFLRGWKMPVTPHPTGYSLPLTAFAHQESWVRGGGKYAALYQDVVSRG